MPRLGAVSSKPGFTHASTPTLITPPSSLTTTDQKLCTPEASLWPWQLLTHVSETYGGTLCRSTTTTMHPPAVPLSPLHSPTDVIFANNFSPDTRSGIVLCAKTVTIVGDAITPATTATTPTPSVSLSQSAWYPSLITMPCPDRHIGALPLPSMLGTILTIGATMVRTTPTKIMTGRLDAWKHYSREGVMS